MKEYKTSQMAAALKVHPNTVRRYEEWGFIKKPLRKENGYRVYTELHLEQMKLARMAFQMEVIQNGLRKRIIEVVQHTAREEYEEAIDKTKQYLCQLRREQERAEEAIILVQELMTRKEQEIVCEMKRKDASDYLCVTVDTLRNWEMNGLLEVKRKKNGYRIYHAEDIRRLKIIRTLRCANYSLESILHFLRAMDKNPETNIRDALHASEQGKDIISVCDHLIDALEKAKQNAVTMLNMLYDMKMNR